MICCENPQIILVQDLRRRFLQCKRFVANGELFEFSAHDILEFSLKFPYHWFANHLESARSRVRDKEFMDNIHDLYFFPSSDGEQLPLFNVVPCGKCILCSESQIIDWKTRCIAETAYSKTPPVFITLTFKEVPVDGVAKRDIQLFMKRLRKDIETARPDNPPIRYIACGEYGRRKGRPHYHLNIWNLPRFKRVQDLVAYIEHLWHTGENSYNKGFVYVTIIDGVHNKKDKYKARKNDVASVVGYICKYLRKDCPNKLNFKNPAFFLASRRGGIGYQHRDKMQEFYQQHPEITNIKILDPFSGTIYEANLPAYYKRTYFKSFKMSVEKEIRDLVDETYGHLEALFACKYYVRQRIKRGTFYTPLMLHKHPWLDDMHKINIAPLIPYRKYQYNYFSIMRARARYRSLRNTKVEDLYTFGESTLIKLHSCLQTLHYYNLDVCRLDKYLSITERHKSRVRQIVENLYENISMEAKADNLRKLRNAAIERELLSDVNF